MILQTWSSLISLFPFEWAQFGFMHTALLAVLLVSPMLAFLGCMVVNKQMAFFSDAIGHSALTGIAIGAIIGVSSPLPAMLIFSLLLAIGITILRRYTRSSNDTVIGIVMSFTIALGIVILSRGGGFNKYSRFLIGDILSITPYDIVLLTIVFVVFLLVWVIFFNRFLIASVNPSLARSRNMNVWLIEALFASITALVVTISIQWIGILVINALLILPAAASRTIAKSTRAYLAYSVLFCWFAGIAGLIVSFYWSTASGATIVIFGMLLYVATLILSQIHWKK